jgi:hypothetical protein
MRRERPVTRGVRSTVAVALAICAAGIAGSSTAAAQVPTPPPAPPADSDSKQNADKAQDASTAQEQFPTFPAQEKFGKKDAAQDGAQTQETPAVTPVPPTPAESSFIPMIPHDLFGIPIQGSFNLRYLYRATSGESDNDLYGFLGLDIGDPATQDFTAHVLAKAAWDVDGDIHHTGASTFDSLEDTYDSRLTAQLYEAYGDWHVRGDVDFVRIGRQILSETPVQTYLDGVRVDTRALGEHSWKLGAYGGIPSHLYESSPQGDVLFGAYTEARPLPATRARLDWMQVQDDYLDSDRNNALVRLAVWQQLGETLSAYGSYSLLDWESRDFEVRGTWTPSDSDLQVEASYYQLLKTQNANAIEFDPYFDIAGEYHPYGEVRASVAKGLGEHFSLAGGADIRWLYEDADEGQFNHDFERWYLQPAILEWPIEGMTITLTGELWDDHDEVITTGEADISQEFTEDTRGHAGTSYSLYKYDFLTMDERDHVRTYYVGVDTRATKQLRLRLDYVYEIDSFDHYHTVRAAATWTF